MDQSRIWFMGILVVLIPLTVGCQKKVMLPKAPMISRVVYKDPNVPDRQLPKFLRLPVERRKFIITEGWLYDKEAPLHPSISPPFHRAVDFKCKRGTPVFAAADGWAIASFHTYLLPDKLGGKAMGFGLGNFIQIWHPDQKVFTSYSHLEAVNPLIPYFTPPEGKNGLYAPDVVYRPFGEVMEKGYPSGNELVKPYFVKAGELIGYVGDTGLSWGYDEKPGELRDYKKFPTWDPAGVHLHFEVYTRNEKGSKYERFDPYGIYGYEPDYKSGKPTDRGCWILDANGYPVSPP